MNDASNTMTNPDRDPDHRRRRRGSDSWEEGRPDGREVAAALYGGPPDADGAEGEEHRMEPENR